MIVVHDICVFPGLRDVLDRPLWSGPAARSEDFQRLARETLDMVAAERLFRPKLVLGIFPVTERDAERLELGGAGRLLLRLSPRTLACCDQVAVAIVTIGPDCEERAALLMERGERLKGLFLDASGSVAVEMAVDKAREMVTETAHSTGLQAGPFVSAGTRGFALDQQFRIWQMLRSELIDVRISSGGMLHPAKSASFLLPLGREMPGRHDDGTCRQCEMFPACAFRRHDKHKRKFEPSGQTQSNGETGGR